MRADKASATSWWRHALEVCTTSQVAGTAASTTGRISRVRRPPNRNRGRIDVLRTDQRGSNREVGRWRAGPGVCSVTLFYGRFERGGGEKVASGDGTSVGCREACLTMNHPPFMKGGKPSVDFDRPIAALGA